MIVKQVSVYIHWAASCPGGNIRRFIKQGFFIECRYVVFDCWNDFLNAFFFFGAGAKALKIELILAMPCKQVLVAFLL